MTIQEVWEIKAKKSQATKNMTSEQLKKYYSDSMREFSIITGKLFKPIKVVSVRPLDDYKLWLRFSTGETKVFDCTKLFDFPVFQRLKDKDIFNSVYVDYGIPVWCDGEIDYCPHALYEQSVPL